MNRTPTKLGLLLPFLATPLIIAGCFPDRAVGASGGRRVQQISGDGQHGRAGDVLSDPLIVRIVSADGTPRADVLVTWSATSGTVSPPMVRTDADGFARATWSLGARRGAYRAWANVEGADG